MFNLADIAPRYSYGQLTKPAAVLTTLLFISTLQSFAQTKLHFPLEITAINGNEMGAWGATIETQLDVDKSVFFGVKRYAFVIDPGYSYVDDIAARALYFGGTVGFNYYLTPTLALQLSGDFRSLYKLKDGVIVMNGKKLEPKVPEGLDMDVAMLFTTRWFIVPFPKFMKIGVGARYTNLLNRTPGTLKIFETTTTETIPIAMKGLWFTINADFCFNLSKRQKL